MIAASGHPVRWACTPIASGLGSAAPEGFDSRIAQALANMLANTLHHTPKNGRVEIRARRPDRDFIEIAVADTGEGIEPKHLDRVFERFYRVDPARSRASGGTGIGLAIVRAIIEAHGGTATTTSVGATFMALNFHLANGGNHPWLIPKDGFNETIDVDAMLVMMQIAFFIFSGYLLLRIRREHKRAPSPPRFITTRCPLLPDHQPNSLPPTRARRVSTRGGLDPYRSRIPA